MTDPTTAIRRRTYRGPGAAGSARLAGLPGVHRVEQGQRETIEVERYDTDDHRLSAAGFVLALRRDSAEPARFTLELPDASEPVRVHVPDDPGVPPALPAELDELVRGVAGERVVRPAARVRTVRCASRLLGPDDRLLAEVVRDDVTRATLGRSTDVDSWTEVELRPAGADDALVEEIERRLSETGMSSAAPRADEELDRLLGRASADRGAGWGPRKSAGAVLLDYLATHADRLAAEDLRVRRAGSDSVHQLRVSARRLRSALQAYRPLLDRERTEPLIDQLRELGRHLAPARDAEVLHERIAAGLAALDPELLLGPVQAQVTRHFTRVEAEARDAVLAVLDGEWYARLRADLAALLDRPPLTKRAARSAKKELPALVARTARRLERAVTVAIDADVPAAERDVAVHAARKAGKRLRYATEVAAPALGKQAEGFAKALKGFQSALGEHQDTVVARDALRALGAQAHAAGENGFSFGVLHGRDSARAASIEQELPDLWAAAWKPRHRRWLR